AMARRLAGDGRGRREDREEERRGEQLEPIVAEERDVRRVDHVIGVEHRAVGAVLVVVLALGDLAGVERRAAGEVLLLRLGAAQEASAGVLRGREVERRDVPYALRLDEAPPGLRGGGAEPVTPWPS